MSKAKGGKAVFLYVEGGGDTRALHDKCRTGFRAFIDKAGLRGKMPRIVACGSRRNAFDDFCTALGNGEAALLLVDSEGPVDAAVCQASNDPQQWAPWAHLAVRTGDGWKKPDGAEQQACHLMVQCMESWFLADVDTLQRYFGQGFSPNALPKNPKIEEVAKEEVVGGLRQSTEKTTKGPYGKGAHSFDLLAQINPENVTKASPWAERFVTALKTQMNA